VLIQEVVHIMGCLMPRFARNVPPTLMRYLMGKRVADQLEVPEHRLLLRMLASSRWMWGETRLFARLARMTCPWVVQWLATCEAQRAHVRLPEEFATRFGSQRV
jgi:hypothetical protein